MEFSHIVHPNQHKIFTLRVNIHNLAHITDQELLDKFYLHRDNQLLGILLQRYTLLLLGVCMKYLKNEEEAKDSVQQIFLKVLTEMQKYKVNYFKSWLYMITRNYCLMKLRNSQGKISKELNDFLPVSEDIELKAEHLEKDEILTLMEMALNELSKEQKTCVIFFYLQKKSYQQISEQTGFTLLQVKSYIQNGKRNLKLLVQKKIKKRNV
jgi:RNA polymerase sigma-70 factor (ECF subfamily)